MKQLYVLAALQLGKLISVTSERKQLEVCLTNSD